jgi:2'-5' RNA ligase
MSKIRCFLAIEIDPNLKISINNIINEFKKTNANIKYVVPENMHLTLKFFGNVSEDMLPKLENVINNVLKNFTEFKLKIEGLGTFPNSNNIKVIWVGIDDNSDLKLLKEKLDVEFTKLGFKKERDYKSHLTIGRMKNSKNKKAVQNTLKENNEVFIGELLVNKIFLKKSTLTPKGSIYEDIHIFSLN